jgi:outer membrane protein assembly factor BamB
MGKRLSHWNIFRVLSLAVLVAVLPDVATSQSTFSKGDIFAAISDGKVNWYHPDGSLVKTLDTGQGNPTTGMAFDASGNLYVTNFSAGNVRKFDTSGNLLGTFGGSYSGSPESIVFDVKQNVYVGAVDGDNDIRKFDIAGNLLVQYDVATEDRGSDWMDLAADQCTMFYTSISVKRYNVCTSTQLPDFASGLHGTAYAMRIVPDGGLLVADSVDIHRLDSSGAIVRTYDAPDEDCWFALNRDPDGKAFWSGGVCTGNFYKFDIATGNILLGPVRACTEPGCLGGLAVFGELTEATAGLTLPWWLWLLPILLLLAALWWWLRRRPAVEPVSYTGRRPRPSGTGYTHEKKPSESAGADVTHGREKKQ